jgi:Cu(I)/Ag(I) efflux system membrane fusion protein
LWAAQQELLAALQSEAGDRGSPALAAASHDLATAARERLELWDLAPRDISAIAASGRPLQSVPVRSPAAGVIVEKNVVAGSAFTAGQVLFRIAGLDPIWVIASVPQADLGRVRPGMTATVHDPGAAAPERGGTVTFVFPALDSLTRAGEVRIAVPNPGRQLQPGMFVSVEIASPAERHLAVPESAVLPTGERFVVFVDLGGGRFAPREVTLGRRTGGWYEVRGGLQPGEIVVTSGNFLVGAESELRSGTLKW